nr:hypothetical protein [Tanacetum cinerariifolium]
SIVKCKTAKEMWNDLILAHEGPSDTRDTKMATLRLKFNAFKALEGEKVNGTYTRLKCLLNDLENNGVIIPQYEVNATFVNSLPRKWLSMNQTQKANNSIKNDCLAAFNSDVEEDNKTSNEFMANLKAEYHERALLANQKRYYKMSRRVGSARKPIDKSKETCFAYGKPENERTVKFKAFMEIAEDEPSVGKSDARSSQWVDITMKKVHRLLSMTDNEERKHVLDYTHVDLQYVEDQRNNLVNTFNALKQDLALHKLELLPGNIVKALGGKGRRKENNSPKEVVFTRADESTSKPAPMITSDSKDDCDSQEPLPALLKLNGTEPSSSSANLISFSDLIANIANLTLNTVVSKKIKNPLIKCHRPMSLRKEVKGIKDQIKIPLDTSPSASQASSSKPSKQKVCEDDEVIFQTSTKGDAFNFNEFNSFPNDDFNKPRTSDTLCNANTKYFPYVPAFDRLLTINYVSPEPLTTSPSLISSTLEDSSILNIGGVSALDKTVHPELATTFESIDLQEDDRDKPIDD